MPEAERTSEYVGIARIQKQEIACFRKQLELLVHEGDCQLWWENTLYSMIPQKQIPVQDIAGFLVGNRCSAGYENIYWTICRHHNVCNLRPANGVST